MDFSSLTLFSTLKGKLNYLSERQAVLAQNVANVDTPDYRAKDVTPPDFQKMAMAASQGTAQKLPLMVTSPKHIMPAASGNTAYKIENRKNTYEKNPDGNNVSIEEEMMKVAQNQAEYSKSLNLYQKMVSLFSTAIDASNTGG